MTGPYQHGQTDVIANPVSGKSTYFAYKFDVNTRFPDRANLSFLNLVSGAPVIEPGLFGYHAYSQNDAFTGLYSLIEPGAVHEWYEQIWFDLPHGELERDARNTAINHLDQTCDLLVCN